MGNSTMLRIIIIVHYLCCLSGVQCNYDNLKDGMSKGTAASIEDFPYFAAIGYYMDLDKSQWVLACSGTIINTEAVLTAASCHYFQSFRRSGKEVHIRANRDYFGGVTDEFERTVLGTVNHPQFIFNYFPAAYGFYHLHDLAVSYVAKDQAFVNEFEQFYPQIIGPNMSLFLHTNAVHPKLNSMTYGIDQQKLTLTSKKLLTHVNRHKCLYLWGVLPIQNSHCVQTTSVFDPVPCGLNRGGPLIWRGVLIGMGSMYLNCRLFFNGNPKYTIFANLARYYEFLKNHTHPNVTFVNELEVID